VFSLPLIAAIPKACGFEAATHFASILLGGSLFPIVVIVMGMAFLWLNTYLTLLSVIHSLLVT
jgi:hypothetical protein